MGFNDQFNFQMMHLHIAHLYQQLQDGVLLGCECYPHYTSEDPYFLTKVDFCNQHQNQADLTLQNKALLHSKSIAYHHVINKVSLKREKEKTSIKPSTSTRCSISQVNSQKQSEEAGSMAVKGYYIPQSRFCDYGRLQMQNCNFSAVGLRLNTKQYAQNQPSPNGQSYHSNKQINYRHQTHPTIKFTVGQPHSALAHTQSEKIISTLMSQSISKRNQEDAGMNTYSAQKNQVDSEQNAYGKQVCSALRRKELKTKKSYETHCSQSSLIKQHAQSISNQYSQSFGSLIRKSQKASLKRAEKGHKRFNTMSDLQEVKSVVDESQLSSDQESIVLVRLHQDNGIGFFDQFYGLRDAPLDGRRHPSKDF